MVWSSPSEYFTLDGQGSVEISDTEEEEAKGLVYHHPSNSGKIQILKKSVDFVKH